jgi:hypothetical protein
LTSLGLGDNAHADKTALFRGEYDARDSNARETIGNGRVTEKGSIREEKIRNPTVRVGLIY